MVRYKLEVRAPSSLSDNLLLTTHGEGSSPGSLSVDDVAVWTRLLTWTVSQDPFAGLTDDETRLSIQKRINESLGPSAPENQRGPSVLLGLIEAIEASTSMWATAFSPDDVLHGSEEDTPVRVRGDIGFVHHLRWVYDVFRDVPGVSFLIR